MSAHTPGPWKVAFRDGAKYLVSGDSPHIAEACIYESEGGCQVTRFPVIGAGEEANARLIAAAPEMLEVLERVAEYLASDEAGEILDAARAAIAKATRQYES